jgi:hypothetical protein
MQKIPMGIKLPPNRLIPGLPHGLFRTKSPNLGKFWRAIDWKMFISRYILWPFRIFLWIVEIFFDDLAHFVFIWCIFFGFGIMYQEKSGNPG